MESKRISNNQELIQSDPTSYVDARETWGIKGMERL